MHASFIGIGELRRSFGLVGLQDTITAVPQAHFTPADAGGKKWARQRHLGFRQNDLVLRQPSKVRSDWREAHYSKQAALYIRHFFHG